MPYIFDHNSQRYKERLARLKQGNNNGAFHYSNEIVKNIIPNVKTNRSWVTINTGECENGAIVFIHNNYDVETNYSYLKEFKDIICVCSVQKTCEEIKRLGLGKPVYLPLSIDVEYVSKFKVQAKTKEACYAGNIWGWKNADLIKYVPRGTQYLTDMSREEMLTRLAQYKVAYCIGRCAIEAKVLGCEVRTCDHRYPDSDMWKVLDNKDAAKMLQKELNKIDGKKGYHH